MLRAKLLITLPIAIAALGFACGDGGSDVAGPTATSAVTEPAPSATDVSLAPAGPATFNVVAGAVDGSTDVEQFMPGTIRMREGDTITWGGQGFEGHTVTFFPSDVIDIGTDEYLVPAPDQPDTLEFNPRIALASDAQGSYDGTEYVNSGFFGVPAPGEYSLEFPKAGVYPYVCMVHPLHMRGVVVVEEADAEVPSPEAVIAEGQRQLARYLEAAADAVDATLDERGRASAGGTAWEVSVGIDTPQAQVLSFLPGNLELETGDTVIFWNSDRDFHNVVFVPDGTDAPQFPILIPPDDGRAGFRLLINPEAANEIERPDGFGPDDLFSSGVMGLTWPRMYYEVTFEQPGTYRYYCTIHTLAGMAGVIEVGPG